MKTQRTVPFVRLLVPFCSGIVVALWVDDPSVGLSALVGVLLSYPIFVALSQRKWPFSLRWVFGVATNLWLAALGYGLAVCHNESHLPRHFSSQLFEATDGLAVVQRMQVQGAGFRLQARLLAIGASSLQPCQGRLLINLRDSTAILQPGDTIVFRRARIQRIAAPLNPAVFDFSRYWHYRNYHYQVVVGADQWKRAGAGARKNLLQLAEQSRSKCVAILRQYLPTDDEWAVGCALILGAKDAMTDEVTQAYSRTGAMHALAVSGMHVAIVWLALAWLLYPLKFLGRPGKYAGAALLITGVWAYAIFTGASASALRAATMVSFLILGQSFQRRHSPFNTLAASAFILLCANPYLLMDAGFQLSYLAVAGILIFDKPLYLCWHITPRWADYLWRLTCVSIAAQLATLPISLYYFHQFPFYFWLSGWVVVPASTLLLYMGGALLALHPVAAVSTILGKGFHAFIWLVNKAVFAISDLPGAVAEQAWISELGVLALYTALLMLGASVLSRRGKWLVWMGIFLFIAAADRGLSHWRAVHQRKVVIYHVPRATMIDVFDGKAAFSYATLPSSHPALHKAAIACRGKHLIKELIPIHTEKGVFQSDVLHYHKQRMQFYDITIAIIDSSYRQATLPATLVVDYLLLSGNPAISLADLQQHYTIRRGIIADASNSYRRVDRWEKACEKAGIVFVDVKEEGAFVIDL